MTRTSNAIATFRINTISHFLILALLATSVSIISCKDDDPTEIKEPVDPDPDNEDSVVNLKPFPQHTVYAEGTIKPNHKSQQQLDQDVINYYKQWRATYLQQTGTNRYYIRYQNSGPVTVSEAHGYGMLVFAMMAGHQAESDEKKIFDGMYHYFKDHPSPINPALMDWQQELQGNTVVSIGGSSATDGDMDIAYALLLADKQWGSDGDIDYKTEAVKIIDALMESVVHNTHNTLKLGDWASSEGTRLGDATRPSDFMIQHMKSFADATGDASWTTVADNCYGIINSVFENYSSSTGLLPDFAEYKNSSFIPAEGELLEAATDGGYGYNAARTPWRIGTDYLINGDKRAEAQSLALNEWIRIKTADSPAKIQSGYYLDGTLFPGRDYEDLTFQSPFMVSAMIHTDNQAWLNALWNNSASKHNSYFGDSITMLSLIVASGNWWKP